MTTPAEDQAHMRAALGLAERGLGDTWPNPTVGCLLTRDGMVVGRGWTQSGGRPHAETEALARAGEAARGASAYVTLEPCSHHGRTPPCADALVTAGIARAVIATSDPDPRVNGAGLARLRAAGIAVTEGVGGAEARAINRGFFLRLSAPRPMFTLKAATSLDGRIALASGESRWITGETARHVVQVLRARHDAIMVGSETAVTDDPALTCRLDGYTGRPKVRVVVDRRLRLTTTSQLVATAQSTPTWVLTTPNAMKARGDKLAAAGVMLRPVPDSADDSAFAVACAGVLAQHGLTRVLIEGGGRLAAAFLKAGLIDEIAWFRASQVLGGDARAAVGDLGLAKLTAAPHFQRQSTMAFGNDTLDLFARIGT